MNKKSAKKQAVVTEQTVVIPNNPNVVKMWEQAIKSCKSTAMLGAFSQKLRTEKLSKTDSSRIWDVYFAQKGVLTGSNLFSPACQQALEIIRSRTSASAGVYLYSLQKTAQGEKVDRPITPASGFPAKEEFAMLWATLTDKKIREALATSK